MVTKELSLTGSTFTQPIRLSGAEITGQLTCRGAQLQGSNADGALVADGLKVGGDVFLDQEFTATGANCETSAIDALCRPVHDPVHPPLG